jgi:hypothetical protein
LSVVSSKSTVFKNGRRVKCCADKAEQHGLGDGAKITSGCLDFLVLLCHDKRTVLVKSKYPFLSQPRKEKNEKKGHRCLQIA